MSSVQSTWSTNANYNSVALHNGSLIEELSFTNNEKYDLFSKIEFKKNAFTKVYTITLHQDYSDKLYGEWLSDAKIYIAAMNEAGYINIDYTQKGVLSFKLETKEAVAKLIKDLESKFTLELPSAIISKVQEFYHIGDAKVEEQKSILLQLCYQGRANDVESLLKHSYGKYKNDSDQYGNKAYHIAYLKNNMSLAKVLKKHYFDINAANKFGHTVLSLAVKDGDKQWFQFAKNNWGSIKKTVSSEDNSNILLIGVKALKELDDLIFRHKAYDDMSDLLDKKKEYIEIISSIAKSNPELISAKNDIDETALYIASTSHDAQLYGVLVKQEDAYLHPWHSIMDWVLDH